MLDDEMIIVLTVFWIIGILWGVYYWYLSPSKANDNKPRVVFDFDSDTRHSASSIESIEYSDSEGTRRKNLQRLKYELKTHWPCETSMRGRPYKYS